MDPKDPQVAIAIAGAAGRMGKRLIALCNTSERVRLAAALEHADSDHLDRDSGMMAFGKTNRVPVTSELPPPPSVDVLIDFTTPKATRALMEMAVERRIAMVIGTTGLSEDDQRAIDEAAKTIAILPAANFSLGVNLLLSMVEQLANRLNIDEECDVEILEKHHRHKIDAPSGTAWAIAKAICDGANKDVYDDVLVTRAGELAKREPGSITMQSLRMGEVVGEHSAFFAMTGEILEIKHSASNRDIFARGALKAAAWLADQQPGRYSMKQMLNL